MEISAIQFWLAFGVFLALGEIVLPGLVSIFVGLGALTVAAFIHYQQVDSVPVQLIIWFVSSTVYIFSLRLLVMKYYPTDTQKQDINEDQLFVGHIVPVTEDILVGQVGRIEYGGTSWPVQSMESQDIKVGEKVKVLRRDNITWLVEKADKEK